MAHSTPTLQEGQPESEHLDPQSRVFYQAALNALAEAGIPCLVGGAYSFGRYTGIVRHTKDFDLFLRPDDARRGLDLLGRLGFRTDLTFPHWLGKAFCGDDFVDLIFSGGNGVARVDEQWFARAPWDEVFGLPVRLVPVEEIIWSKSFVMERERFDGADVAHLLRSCADTLDWHHLLDRFGDKYWRVLLAHLTLFGFVYPCEMARIPRWVMEDLAGRVLRDAREAPESGHVCQGTLVSREQYLKDVHEWGYQDARTLPDNPMTGRDIAHWTAGIEKDGDQAA